MGFHGNSISIIKLSLLMPKPFCVSACARQTTWGQSLKMPGGDSFRAHSPLHDNARLITASKTFKMDSLSTKTKRPDRQTRGFERKSRGLPAEMGDIQTPVWLLTAPQTE